MACLSRQPFRSPPESQRLYLCVLPVYSLRVRKWWIEAHDKQIDNIECGEFSHVGGHILRAKSLSMAFEMLSNFMEIKCKLNLFASRAFEGLSF